MSGQAVNWCRVYLLALGVVIGWLLRGLRQRQSREQR